MPGKPVALFKASSRASEAQASLRLVLNAIAARLVDEASLTLQLLAKDEPKMRYRFTIVSPEFWCPRNSVPGIPNIGEPTEHGQ
jgi:hypothetical protein